MLDGLNSHNQSFIHFFSIFSNSVFSLKSSGKSFCFTNSNFSNWNSILYLTMWLLNQTIRSCQVAFLFKSSSICVDFLFNIPSTHVSTLFYIWNCICILGNYNFQINIIGLFVAIKFFNCFRELYLCPLPNTSLLIKNGMLNVVRKTELIYANIC